MRFTMSEVENVILGGLDWSDYPEMTDAFIEEATCKETGRKLTEREVEQLSEDYPDWINEMACAEGAERGV